MRHRAQRTVPIFVALGLLFPGAASVRAADQEIDRLLQNPVAKDWVTNGGNMTNQRYSRSLDRPRSSSVGSHMENRSYRWRA